MIEKVELLAVDGVLRLEGAETNQDYTGLLGGGGPAPDLTSILSRLGAAEALNEEQAEAVAALQVENAAQAAALTALETGGGGAAPGEEVKIVQLPTLEWWQTDHVGAQESWPAEQKRIRVEYKDTDADHWMGDRTRLGKVVTQAHVEPSGMAFVFQQMVLGGECVASLPDVNPVRGGEWEFKMPWPHMTAGMDGRPADVRGYWREIGYLFLQDKSQVIAAVAQITTRPPANVFVAVRAPLGFAKRFEKGVVNLRSPLYVPNPHWNPASEDSPEFVAKLWHQGCVYEVQLRYPVGRAVYLAL